MTEPPIIVVGAGVIGLASVFHLVERGRPVILLDRSAEGDPPGASSGNAGAIAVTECVPASVPGLWRRVPGWLLDPLGPLYLRPAELPRLAPWLMAFLRAGRAAEVRRIARALAGINAAVYPALVPMLERIGLAHALHRDGSLVLYRDAVERDAHALEWELKCGNGVRFELVDRAAITDLEPAVGPTMTAGVFQPDWSTVSDPAAIVRSLRDHLAARGFPVRRAEVRALVRRDGRVAGVRLADGTELAGSAVVLATGAWSAALAPDRVLLASERGYNTTLPRPGVEIRRQLTFGAAHFVATPLSTGLRIGGAAEFAGLDAPANLRRAEALLTLARRALPGLDAAGGTVWMGQRPSTPDSLPVIGNSPSLPGLVYAFGHGHLGLTHSAPTGWAVAALLSGTPPLFDLAPFTPARFA